MNYRLLFCLCLLSAGTASAQPDQLELTLSETRELVLRQNLEIAIQQLGFESALALYEGERRAFWEPVLVLSGERLRNQRENNSEQFISQGVDDFEENNRIYRLAVEQPLPTGATVQLGYTLRDLQNNLREQRELEGPSREYEGFLGLVFTQPLLRNAGVQISSAMIRMAREESEAAFQEWRRQLMQAIGSAEAAYWELQIAQRRVALREASVRVAEQILEDNRARLEAGRVGEAEVQQAEAGLAIRETQLLEARQQLIEASNRLSTFFSESIRTRNLVLRATEEPVLREMNLDLDPLFDLAMTLHPDILIRQHRLNQEQIRTEFNRNQRLPELGLSASYGFNSLGESSSDAWSGARDSEFVSWSVGLQLRMPLGGNHRAQGEYRASRLRKEQAETGLQATEVALLNQLGTSARRVENNLAQARNNQRVAALNALLLQTELARLEAGQSDSRRVLETEERLTEALEAEATSITRFTVALLELELASGTLLKDRDLEPMHQDRYQPRMQSLPGEAGEQAPFEPRPVPLSAPAEAEAPAAEETAAPELVPVETPAPAPSALPVSSSPVRP